MQKTVKSPKTKSRRKVAKYKKRAKISTIIKRIQNIILKSKHSKYSKLNRYSVYGFTVIIVFFLIWFFTHDNAYHVMIDTARIGTIAKSKNITDEDILNSAISSIEFELNSNITTDQTITFVPVRSSRKNISSIDNIISKVKESLNYKVEAFSIVVDGVDIATANSQEIADNILKSILKRYEYEDTDYVSTIFLEDVKIVPKYVNLQDIMSEDRIRAALDKTTNSQNSYTVKQGDSLSKIASNLGINVSEIIEINENINQNTVLQINQEIIVPVPKTILSVETRTETKYTEIIRKNVQTVQSSNHDKGTSTILQRGSDGQKEITAHVIRVNGIEVGNEIVNEKITIEPVDEIIQVGIR